MSLIAATQLTAVATLALAMFAVITAVVAYLAFRKQSAELADQRALSAEQTKVLRLQADELSASLSARKTASLELREQWAATVVAWHSATLLARGWLAQAHAVNTGNRPVRNVTATWYAGESALQEPLALSTCLMPGERVDFQYEASSDEMAAGLLAIVEFRTVGADWWRAGTDGTLLGGMEVSDVQAGRS